MRAMVAYSLFMLLGSLHANEQTYDLPSLLIYTNQEFLQKGHPTELSCQIIAGWSGATLHEVAWLKDGQRLEIDSKVYVIRGHTLTISDAHQAVSEGEYQCQGILKNLTLSEAGVIETQLISSPLKLRRARISKFEQISDITVRTHEGSVTRIPCAGMPDVIPGPPELFYDKDGTNETFGEVHGQGRFLLTGNGMQIAMVNASDEGKYYCVVRNDQTRQFRRSPKPVTLIVEKRVEDMIFDSRALVYPSRLASLDQPVLVHVVAGNDILIECVFEDAKINWAKVNETLNVGTHESARIRQIWGNLRIANVSQGDVGIYTCEARPVLQNGEMSEEVLVVHYQLIAHAPTDVHLSLKQDRADHSWTLSCFAQNLRYEIPMVFVNATPLIDAVETMGIATHTNFYTNPINVTIYSPTGFSGSVQCISRPAMEEAEIYGVGLERGRSRNVYVIGGHGANLFLEEPQNLTVVEGESASLKCQTQKARSKQWRKGQVQLRPFQEGSRVIVKRPHTLFINSTVADDEGWYSCIVEDENRKEYKSSAYLSVITPSTHSMSSPSYPTMSSATAATTTVEVLQPKKRVPHANVGEVRGFVVGNDVRLQWEVIGEPESQQRIVEFVVQSIQEGEVRWTEVDRKAGHIRATTLVNLTPYTKFKFRVNAIREDKTASTSPESAWFETRKPTNEVIPDIPKVTKVEALSTTSIRIVWTQNASQENAQPHRFIVAINRPGVEPAPSPVEANLTSHVIGGLASNTTYQIVVYAENDAGKSDPSPVQTVTTFDMDSNGLFSLFVRGIKELFTGYEGKVVLLLLGGFLILLIACLVCTIICCHLCNSRDDSINKAANGKFLDASFRIFNEQKVHKSRVPRPYDCNVMNGLFTSDSIDEDMPLRGNNNDDRISLNSRKSFLYRRDGALPNMFGRLGNNDDSDGEGDPLAPLEAHYNTNHSVECMGTARCFSTDTGRSREVLVPPPPPLLSTGGGRYVAPPTSPLPIIPSLIGTGCSPSRAAQGAMVAYKCGENTVVAYSPSSLADSGGSGGTRTTAADSPTLPQ